MVLYIFGAAIALALLMQLAARWRQRRVRLPEDLDEDTPYRIYASEFDVEIAADELPARLAVLSPDAGKGWLDDGNKWRAAISAYDRRQNAQQIDASTLDGLESAVGRNRHEQVAITFLVDQSGSMRGRPSAVVTEALATVSQLLASYKVGHEILGFSTAGWHGGFPRDRWRQQGQIAYPGRLCALLHIVHKPFSRPTWSRSDQHLMLHPDALRENVDGEALLWAAARLRGVTADRRLLLVISDGAPVDDSTLLENGPSILYRHTLSVIADLEYAEDFEVRAVGINHRVEKFYAQSQMAKLDQIAPAIVRQVSAFLDPP